MFPRPSAAALLRTLALSCAATTLAPLAPLATASAADYGAAVAATPGLMSYWKLDELGGVSGADSAGSNPLQFTSTSGLGIGGAPGIAPVSRALATNATQATADGAAFSFAGSAPYTVSAWVRPLSAQPGSRFILDNEVYAPARGGMNMGMTNAAAGSALFCQRYGTTGTWSLKGKRAIAIGAWTHVACSFDGTNLTTWVNGEPDTTRTAGAISDSSATPLGVGRRSTGGNQFLGSLDDVAIFDRALSDTQLAALHASGQNYEQAVLGASGHRSYLPLNDAGAAQTDLGPLAAHAAAPDTAAPAAPLAGDTGRSLALDGAGPLLSPALQLQPTMTVELWFRSDHAQDAWLWHAGERGANGGDGPERQTGLQVTTEGRLRLFSTGLASPALDLGRYTPGRTHHVALTISGTIWRAYVDGEQRWAENLGTPDFSSYLPSTAFGGLVGGGTSGALRGQLDDVISYGRALSPGEIASHWNLGRDQAPPQTTIDAGPADGADLSDSTVSFDASADEELLSSPGFRYSLDGAPPTPCSLPLSLRGLAPGEHVLTIAAQDAAGNWDPTPATRRWTVRKPTMPAAPADPAAPPVLTPSRSETPESPSPDLPAPTTTQSPRLTLISATLPAQPQAAATARLGARRLSQLRVPTSVASDSRLRFRLNRRSVLLVRAWYEAGAAGGREQSGSGDLVRAARMIVKGRKGTNAVSLRRLLRTQLPDGRYLVSVRIVQRRKGRTVRYSAPLYASTHVQRKR